MHEQRLNSVQFDKNIDEGLQITNTVTHKVSHTKLVLILNLGILHMFWRTIVLGLLLTATVSANAVTLTIDPMTGQLLGAEDVGVNGEFFDVAFLDGTCGDLFNGCDEAGDFAFPNEFVATEAVFALLDQVFVDGQGQFDSNPGLTFGCDSAPCFVDIPVFSELGGFGSSGPGPVAVSVTNAVDEVNDGVFPFFALVDPATDSNALGATNVVFAVFTPVAPVPIPAALPFFLASLAGLGVMRRCKNKVQLAA